MEHIILDSYYKGGFPNPKYKILTVHFFYQHTNLCLEIEGNNEMNNFIIELEKVPVTTLKSDEDFLLEQLNEIKQLLESNEEITHQQKMIYMMNIYWLTKIDVIKSDKFNGMMIFYTF